MAAKKKERCLTPGCREVVDARGLCTSCYRSAHWLVISGKDTWEALVAEGKALAKQKPGPKPTRFTEAYRVSAPVVTKPAPKSRKVRGGK